MKLLLYIPEFPFAHHGGAARSMRTIGEFMALKGHEVHCVCTTATERPMNGAGSPPCPENLLFRGVKYNIVDTARRGTRSWRSEDAERTVNYLWDVELLGFKPDIVLAYGGHPTDERRYDHAKKSGAKLVFRLSNFGYTLKPSFFNRMDGIITCSQFLTDWYKTKIGITSMPMPLPIWYEDVVAEKRTPKYFTFINPARRKGLVLMAEVFKALIKDRRGDIPLMVVGESDEPEFAEMSKYAKVLPWQTVPKAIYAETKVLLVPSVWEEPAGRVVAEAMLNGIPPIISNRGGLQEVANGGAYVLSINPAMKPETRNADPIDVEAWADLIVIIHDDKPNRDGGRASIWSSDRAIDASMIYNSAATFTQYEAYFNYILYRSVNGPGFEPTEAPATERRTGSQTPQYGATPEKIRC